MSPQYYKSKSGIGELLDNYSSDGIEVLTAEPSRTMRAVILVLVGLLFSALIWSFIGKADVVVKARGSVAPEDKQYKVQTPIKGQLVNIYVTEGMPVAKGDIVARINSSRAMQMAGSTATTKIQYDNAIRAYEQFPEQKRIMEMQAESMKAKLESDRLAQARVEAEALAQLGEEQSIKLQKARTKLEKAADSRDHAKAVLESHLRLFNSAGGGGISRKQVTEKQKEYKDKMLDYELALSELGGFEVTLSKAYTKKKAEIGQKAQALMGIQRQYDKLLLDIAKQEQKLEADIRMQRTAYLASEQITFDDIDEENYLRLRAPMDGVVTKLMVEQTGINIEDKTPILMLAPEGSRKVLVIAIQEKDRAFLRVGMQVNMKFNAFSYQRYGFIRGELEFISPITSRDPQSKAVFYTARVGLNKDYFRINGDKTPIRYGMGASAEITVRKRRIIDIVLDPIRNIAG